MILTDEKPLMEMAEAIVREVDPERIIFFGSRARGDNTEESDIDLLVIRSEPFGPGHKRRQEIARIRRALSSFRMAKDILVYSSDEFAKWQHSLNHVIARSLQEGKTVYERS